MGNCGLKSVKVVSKRSTQESSEKKDKHEEEPSIRFEVEGPTFSE